MIIICDDGDGLLREITVARSGTNESGFKKSYKNVPIPSAGSSGIWIYLQLFEQG